MSARNHFAKPWDHHLSIKELWAEPVEGEDDDAQAARAAPEVARRVQALADSVRERDTYLAYDLEDIADGFACVAEDNQPQRLFNHLLAELYDLGDRDKRVWVG